jgi:hypothetical protein
MIGNVTDDYHSPFSAYSLPSDTSRFISYSFQFDSSSLNPLYRIPAFVSIGFGFFILIHSAILHKREMHFVRFCTDFAAFNMCLAATLTFVAVYRPNATKSALTIYVFGTGFCAQGIQLCDMYMFYNRLLAVTKIPPWKKFFTYFYIYAIITGPYYSSYVWFPLFYDLNSNGSYLSVFLLSLNAWGNLAFNTYFTFEFVYVLYNIYGEKDFSSGSSNRNITLIVIKSLLHFVTSSLANLLYSFYYIFYVDEITSWFFYNMAICFGLHFFFNVKNDELILALMNCLYATCPRDTSLYKSQSNVILHKFRSFKSKRNSKIKSSTKSNTIVPQKSDDVFLASSMRKHSTRIRCELEKENDVRINSNIIYDDVTLPR